MLAVTPVLARDSLRALAHHKAEVTAHGLYACLCSVISQPGLPGPVSRWARRLFRLIG